MHQRVHALVDKYPDLQECAASVEAAFDIMAQAYRQGGKLLICGNGGSAADCEHIVGELMKGFMRKRPVSDSTREKLRDAFPLHGDYLADHLQGGLPAISLVSQSSLSTAFINDIAADMVFAQQVYGYGLPGDVVWGISTSGNSRNVVHALQVGRAMGLRTIGLTGRGGGAMQAVCDVTMCVPYDSTPAVQERHLPIYHALCIMLEEEFFSS